MYCRIEKINSYKTWASITSKKLNWEMRNILLLNFKNKCFFYRHIHVHVKIIKIKIDNKDNAINVKSCASWTKLIRSFYFFYKILDNWIRDIWYINRFLMNGPVNSIILNYFQIFTKHMWTFKHLVISLYLLKLDLTDSVIRQNKDEMIKFLAPTH